MYLRLIQASCVLAFIAVVLSAYVRLSDAGLGCTDWPTCYKENALKERQVSPTDSPRGYTSWQRKLHSQVVMLLGFLSIAISGLAWLKRKELGQSPLLPFMLTLLMIFLAAFGIWAFSHLPRAIIVPVHLAGGVSMLILLTWMLLRQHPQSGKLDNSLANRWRFPAQLGLALVIAQIMLGGWVSSNFAGIACSDFPLCQGVLLPPMDFSYSYATSGSLLPEERLTAIHWMHRFGALLTVPFLIWFGSGVMRIGGIMRLGATVVGLVALQFALGVGNVILGLPLIGAVLHNAFAMLLLVVLVTLNYRLKETRK